MMNHPVSSSSIQSTTIDSDEFTTQNPYQIAPFFQHKEEAISSDPRKPVTKVIHSIVTPIPISLSQHNGTSTSSSTNNVNCEKNNCMPQGEIQISIEEVHQHNSPILRRIAVRSYGDTSAEGGIIHASFSIPLTPFPKQNGHASASSKHKPNWICWANFDSKPYLCVLTESEKLRIFDVYPCGKSAVGGGEGHSVSLPFEASGIFSLGGFSSGGLLIQRQYDPMDITMRKMGNINFNAEIHAQNASASASASAPLDLMVESPSTVPGLVPPPTLRLGLQTKTFEPRLSSREGTQLEKDLSIHSSCSSDSDIDRMISPQPTQLPEDLIPSLYTLHHPLEEARPCAIVQKDSNDREDARARKSVWRKNANFCELEQVIFVGEPRCFSNKMTDLIVVTFHVQKRCHRVWVLRNAPPPPKTVPLWKVTSRSSAFKATSASTTPFSDLHAVVSLTCIHTIEKNGFGLKEASRVFLATNLEGSGDFILALLLPSNENRNSGGSLLKCIEFDPLGQTVQGGPLVWNVINDFKVPCKSALPIESTRITPKPFQVRYDPTDGMPQRQFLRKEYGLLPPHAIDILLCGREGGLNLFRGGIHIIDLDVSLPGSQTLSPIELVEAVKNRGDIIFGAKEDHHPIHVRVSCSLASTCSALTDMCLTAICSAFGDQPVDRKIALLELGFAIRSDSLKFAQFRSSLSMSHDVEWESFSIILMYFLTAICDGTFEFVKESKSTTSAIDENDAWSDLLQSTFHTNYTQVNKNKFYLGSVGIGDEEKMDAGSKSQSLSLEEVDFLSQCRCVSFSRKQNWDASETLHLIFDALHMLYEDLKIKRGSNALMHASSLADLLYELCKNSSTQEAMLMKDFMKHYSRDFPHLGKERRPILGGQSYSIPTRLTSEDKPPSVYSWMEEMMEDNSCAQSDLVCLDEKYKINGSCSASGALLRFYSIIFCDKITSSCSGKDRRLISAIVEEGILDASRLTDIYSPILMLPLMDAIFRCRLDPPPLSEEWPSSAFKLIGRNDLAQIKDNCKPTRAENSAFVTSSFRDDDPDNDGLVYVEKYSAMLFPNDTRCHEAARLLRSSRPLFLRVKRAPEVNDHDYERLKQQKLALLCRRLLTLPVGRGMLTLGTLESIPIEPLPMPKMCLAGRIPPQNAILALEDNRCTSKHKMWPDFHNGVAAGLRLPLCRDDAEKLSRTWIVCNKPKPPPPEPAGQPNQANTTPEPDHTYGGFLLALGLRGHLSSLSKTDICDYINEGPVTTAVGMMLGLAANKRGTCNVTISKTLCVHIPSLLPTSFRSIDLPGPVQTAAVAGVGLLCQGSSHRLLTEFLLNEMGKRPAVDQNTEDRESYTLCCGISLGMVNLCLMDNCKKSVNDGLSDLNIEERLHRYIVGGVDHNVVHRKHHSSERSSAGNNVDNEKSSRIFEGGMINTDITAPGATLALGMIYHRSGSKSAASLVALPDTTFALDCVRPDFLFLRVVSRSLILWDEIEPTSAWMESQMPKIVKDYYLKFKRKAEKASGLEGLATFAAMTMSVDSQVVDVEMKDEDKNEKDASAAAMKNEAEMDVDYNSIRQAHAYITAGLCFSLGLRYAGTGDEIASNTIYTKIFELQKLRDGNDTISSALRPDIPTVELCLGSAAVSLAMVMAGTGDLKAFRLFKALRWKCDMDVKYGNHMAYASAIGLLFLGGGTCTIGNEADDIAALLISFFPRYPIFTHDNRYHLQALRHLYALAVKERKVEAIDVDSNEKILLPMKFDFGNESAMNVTTPNILLNKGTACKISVSSDRYYPAEVLLKNVPNFNSTLSIFVKKKAGRLSYIQDPHGLRSFYSQIESGNGATIDFIRSFIEDRKLIAFANYMSSNSSDGKEGIELNNSSREVSILTKSLEDFCLNAIQEALKEEKTEAIMTRMAIYVAITTIQKISCPSKTIWELRILRSFYQSSTQFELVDPHFVASVCETIDKLFSKGGRSSISQKVFETESDSLFDNTLCEGNIHRWRGSVLIWYNA